MTPIIEVKENGTVFLGSEFSADGYGEGRRYRIQTHSHSDHMGGFRKSLSYGNYLVMTPETRDLLQDLYPQLPSKTEDTRLLLVEFGKPRKIETPKGKKFTVTAERANHMLGAAQYAVEMPDGTRVGYSGDFSYNLDKVIEVEQLVVDATYGNPDTVRDFTQADAEEVFSNHVRTHCCNGGVEVIAKTGVAERALMSIATSESDHGGQVPIILDAKLRHYAEIYKKYEMSIPSYIVKHGSDDQIKAVESGEFIRFWQDTAGGAVLSMTGSKIKLHTPFPGQDVVSQIRDGITQIGFSNHATHLDTMDYIERSGARIVVTDASRAGFNKARALAVIIKRDLGIQAYPLPERPPAN